MKLQLYNFKCYRNKTFNFNNNSNITLLSGDSGKGKSTILQSIYFALYGTLNKVIMHGEKSCSVTLEFKDIIIKRIKGPNKLIVNNTIYNDEAQEFINRRFGTRFDITGYIPQTMNKSFILMSGADKLQFLEEFIHSEIDIDAIKRKSKDNTARLNTELSVIKSKIETCDEFLSNMQNVTKPQEPDDTGDIEEKLDIRRKLSECKNKILERLHVCKREYDRVTFINDHIQLNKDDLESFIETRVLLKNEIDLYDKTRDEKYIRDARLYLDNYKKHLKIITLVESIKQLELKLDEIKTAELDNYKVKINKLSSRLWNGYDSEMDFLDNKKCVNDCLIDAKELDEIISSINEICSSLDISTTNHVYTTKDISQLQDELVIQNSNMVRVRNYNSVYTCPSCNSMLHLHDDKLTTYDGDNNIINKMGKLQVEDVETIEEINQRINAIHAIILLRTKQVSIESKYESVDDIPVYEDLKLEQQEIEDYEIRQRHIIDKINELKLCVQNNIVKGETYNVLARDLKNKNDELAIIKSNYTDDFKVNNAFGVTEYDIMENIAGISKRLSHMTNINTQYINMEERISKIRNTQQHYLEQHILIYKQLRKADEITEEIDIIEKKIGSYEHDIEKINHQIEIIKNWQSAQKDYEECESWYNRKLWLLQNEKTTIDEYKASIQLKEIISNCESYTVMNLLNKINTHAKIYLDLFFVDDISVTLSAFKSNKKGVVKPEVSISILYKGMECDLLMLSGGEIARVVLAFTLALGEIFNTPLLLLDECTASLDEETAGEVFDVVKEHLKGVFTIVVAHQVVTGVFEEVICL